MSTYFLLKTALVLHISGFVMLAGTTLADYIVFRQFWKYLQLDKQKAMTINSATAKFPALTGLGMGLVLISGITMVAVYQGALDGQIWFRIKMLVVVLLILNSLIIARPAVLKLKKLLSADEGNNDMHNKIQALKGRISTFHVIQMLLFIIVFILSAFRFN